MLPALVSRHGRPAPAPVSTIDAFKGWWCLRPSPTYGQFGPPPRLNLLPADPQPLSRLSAGPGIACGNLWQAIDPASVRDPLLPYLQFLGAGGVVGGCHRGPRVSQFTLVFVAVNDSGAVVAGTALRAASLAGCGRLTAAPHIVLTSATEILLGHGVRQGSEAGDEQA